MGMETSVCRYDFYNFENYIHIFLDIFENFKHYIYIFLDILEDPFGVRIDNNSTAEGAGRHCSQPSRHDALHMCETMQRALLRIEKLSQRQPTC